MWVGKVLYFVHDSEMSSDASQERMGAIRLPPTPHTPTIVSVPQTAAVTDVCARLCVETPPPTHSRSSVHAHLLVYATVAVAGFIVVPPLLLIYCDALRCTSLFFKLLPAVCRAVFGCTFVPLLSLTLFFFFCTRCYFCSCAGRRHFRSANKTEKNRDKQCCRRLGVLATRARCLRRRRPPSWPPTLPSSGTSR